MGNAVHDKDSQLSYLKNRLNMFLEVLDSMDPESTDVEDIDRLLKMLDELEFKHDQFKKSWDE
jgi:ribosome biogenesis GTPase A